MAVKKQKASKVVRKAKRKKKWIERNQHERSVEVRALLLEEAKRVGVLSNERACEVSKVLQPWYHLRALVETGKLKRAGYNQWMPVR